MAKRPRKNYLVAPRDGKWRVEREGAKRISGVYKTKQQAEKRARELVNKSGGKLRVVDRKPERTAKNLEQKVVLKQTVYVAIEQANRHAHRVISKSPIYGALKRASAARRKK